MIARSEHCIVAIGASAGGLEAIHEFFDHMPGKPDASFIIIQHLSPDHKSLLVELVGRHTQMTVVEAGENMQLVKNCIYVIPNNKLMTVENNRLVLEAKKVNNSPNNAIDFFLLSLAAEKKHRSIAVILSGTGSDGTRGIEAVKKAGGLVIVQDPETAKFNGMPNSAIQSGLVDQVLAPADMPEEILRHLAEPVLHETQPISETQLEEIFNIVHKEAGNDFHLYKLPTISRRIFRRMAMLETEHIDSYLEILRADPVERQHLAKDFLIGVTKFFRDNEAFESLKDQVLQPLIRGKNEGDTIKLWVCACSTGEEAYSLAIMIDHLLTEANKTVDVKIFATDIDEAALDIAGRGCYPASVERDIPEYLLRKYFLKKGSQYQIIPAIRKQIVFAKHNVSKDPPFINNDLVSCRNMLIYLGPVLQQKVLAVLLYGVMVNKYLVLGPSETIANQKDDVIELNPKWKIYRKQRETKILGQFSPERTDARISKTDQSFGLSAPERPKVIWDDLKQVLNDDLHFAAFYIDQNFNIRDSAGNYSRFLSMPRKVLQLNLLSMVPQELYLMLGAEIRKAIKQNLVVQLPNIRLLKNDLVYSWHILIKPTAPFTLVVISETEVMKAEAQEHAISTLPGNLNDEYIRSLESELTDVKGRLQFAIEDLESTNEELQSSNEELLSANEELQSSNEELQSLNEELHTLNTEHQLKIKELVELNDDLNNYFRSVDIGQIFLDTSLNIRKFNAAAASTVNLIEADIGRPIHHISNNIKYDHFIRDLQTVLHGNEVMEKEVALTSGKQMLMRMMPYLTQDRYNRGVIISFVDITLITNLNNIIRGVLNSNPSVILAFEAVRERNKIVDFRLTTANPAAKVLLPEGEPVGLSLLHDVPLLAEEGFFEKFRDLVEKNLTLNTDVYIKVSNSWYNLVAARMMDGLVATFTDITTKKISEEKIRKSYVELIMVKDNLKVINEQLENKVTERTRALAASEERFRLVARATNDALWDWDLINNKTWWGETFYKLFGYEDMAQDTDRNFWLDKIHPDDKQSVQNSLNQAINSNNTQWSQEYRFLRENGSYAHILDRGYILHDEFDTPYRMLGSMFDLTELRQAEQQVASSIAQRKFLAESMPLIVWTADKDGQLNFVNRQFELYTGGDYRTALGDGWKTFVEEQDLPGLVKKFETSLSEKSDFSQELRLRHRSGEYRWNILRAKVSHSENAEMLDIVITISDIHEHKVMNELLEKKVFERTRKLKELNQALEVSNHDLLQFASVASHDLQEPVRKIQMFTKLLADKYSQEFSPVTAGYLSKIIHASARMKMLITDILNYSRLSAADNRFSDTDLSILLQDTLEDFEMLIKEKSAVIIADRLPVVEVIPGQIRQVFHNLISNALKFTGEDKNPEIRITCSAVNSLDFEAPAAPDGQFYRLEFIDNGIGFDDQFAGDIFDLFKRLHSKDRYEGTGIGLAITQKIVEKHSGLIKAESKDEFGARFVIILPAKQEQYYPNQ